jgi:hypothetical protein
VTFKHRDGCGRRLDLRVRDGAFLFGWAGNRGIIIGLRLGNISARSGCVIFGLVERLLSLEVFTRQRRGPRKLNLRVLQACFRLVDFILQRVNLLTP